MKLTPVPSSRKAASSALKERPTKIPSSLSMINLSTNSSTTPHLIKGKSQINFKTVTNEVESIIEQVDREDDTNTSKRESDLHSITSELTSISSLVEEIKEITKEVAATVKVKLDKLFKKQYIKKNSNI